MTAVPHTIPIHAVRWPTGGIEQWTARATLLAHGFEPRLYDGTIQTTPDGERYPDGTDHQWASVSGLTGGSAKVGDWVMILPGGIAVAVSDEAYRKHFEESP